MKALVWLVVLAGIGVLGYALWSWRERWREHQRVSEERLATFMAQARPVTAPPADNSLPQQKLLFEAAG